MKWRARSSPIRFAITAFSGPSMRVELPLGELEIPSVPVADLDLDETGRAQRSGALLESGHVVGDAFEAEKFHHFL